MKVYFLSIEKQTRFEYNITLSRWQNPFLMCIEGNEMGAIIFLKVR